MNASYLAPRVGAALLLASAAFGQTTWTPKGLAPQIGAPREYTVPGYDAAVRMWAEVQNGQTVTLYQVSLHGEPFSEPAQADYSLLLRHGNFDPRRQVPSIAPGLLAPANNRLYIVQYWTRFLEDYGSALSDRNVESHRYMPNQANIVEMSAALANEVRSLPFVRSVTPFHPAFKLEEELINAIELATQGPVTVNILTMRRGGQAPVVQWIENNGGTIQEVSERTYLMTATLDHLQLPALAALNEVQWIDRWGPETADMNVARQMHGADFVESVAGYDGTGIRGEVRDIGCSLTHQDLPNFLVHGTNSSNTHGTSTGGICFGKGLGNANARGAMPDGFLVIQDIDHPAPGGSRYNATAEIQDPTGPFRCVFQTNSVGGPQTTQYNSTSQNMDLILFDFDHLPITQSQSNLNNKNSRPEAWAKNIISVGGINHFNTLTKNDDLWGGASIGPANDGRIKPDLASYYDAILAPTAPNNYTSGFGGTSGATPIVAGHLGLFLEMWNDGIFGNPTPGAGVFENRPTNMLTKAMLINTATQWQFTGATHNRTRVHQGWGHPDLQYMYENRNNMLIVDEADVLGQMETKNYYVNVTAGNPEFRVTMSYRDLPGTTSATLHRINDLDLAVIAPDGTLYKGNVGLIDNMASTANGAYNKVDTVENVIVTNPAAGEWRITIYARDINADSHIETPALDVDFALVATIVDSEIAACGTARNIAKNPFGNPNRLTMGTIVPGQPTNVQLDATGFATGTIIGLALPDVRPLDSGTVMMVATDSPVFFRVGPLPGGGLINVNQVLVTDPALCGKTIYVQGRLNNPVGAGVVTNAIDAVVGN